MRSSALSFLSCSISLDCSCSSSSFLFLSSTLSGSTAPATPALVIAFSLMPCSVCAMASSSDISWVMLNALERRRRDVGIDLVTETSSHDLSSCLYLFLVCPVERIPLYARASRSSIMVKLSTPSAMIITSSALMALMRCSSRYLRNASLPKGVMSRSLHRLTSCPLPIVSRVMSSVKSLLNFVMSSLAMSPSPSRTRRMKCTNSSAVTQSSSFFLISAAICSTVLCRNFATSILALSCFFMSSSTFHSCLKVEGSIPGKSQRATGSMNSMNGMMTNIRKGTALSTSEAVVRSWRCSLLVSSSPSRTWRMMRKQMVISLPSSFVPTQ
mmetsp:Transcript_7628/g.19549  ORF Transcript_7628/g.19549 Transcript_7628/m.19549 type:complete len:327 (-) Transcript_7628:175-1155(-)